MVRSCRFCVLVSGAAPCHKVFEDDAVLAFMDAAPVHAGHILIIPKRHVVTLNAMRQDEYLHIMSVVHSLSKAIKRSVHCKRVGILVAGFDIAHAHVHVIPMTDIKDVCTKRVWSGEKILARNADLKRISRMISSAIK
ncbi:TPA: HIT domain-containing protein [Candidatus Woesearchaeota archaeon]|nr:HIT domain-containing protein [Candidatus Woesearchaeota archaeon]